MLVRRSLISITLTREKKNSEHCFSYTVKPILKGHIEEKVASKTGDLDLHMEFSMTGQEKVTFKCR